MKKYPVVILPGWLLDSQKFILLAEELKRLGYTVHVVSFPGFGDGPKLPRVYNLTDFVTYVRKFLKSNKIERAIFVCHSFGGRVALKLLSQHPQLAQALILSGTPGYPTMNKVRRIITVSLAKVGRTFVSLIPIKRLRQLFQKIFYRIFRISDYSRVSGEMRDTFKTIVNESLVSYMQKLRLPTLLLWGENDKMVKLRIARRMQKTIKNSQLKIIPNSGHMFTYRDPKMTATAIDEFINRL